MLTDENTVKILASMAQFGRDQLFYFAESLCEFGKNPDPNGPRLTEDQRELFKWLQTDPSAHRMVFTPRDTLKSTCLQAYVLWKLLHNPNLRVLLYGEVHEQAQKRLAVIKRVIEQGQTFNHVYGAWKGTPWNEDMIGISKRTNTSLREASIETAGLDVVINARHFDLICVDDVHSEKNTKTRDQIDGVQEKIELLMPLLSKGGEMLFAGVFWSDQDVYSRFMERPSVKVFMRAAIAADGTAAYPHQLPLDVIEQKREFMRSDLFACHYMMDPVPKSTAKFKREWFTEVPRQAIHIARTFLLIDQAGDPTAATEAKRDSDNFAIVTAGLTSAGDVVLLDVLADKLNPTQAVEGALLAIKKHNPFVIGVERAGIGNLQFYLREELRKIGRFAVVLDLNPRGRSKYQRIMELEPLARTRRIFISSECNQKEDFLEEITRFPKAKHDDIIDSLAYLTDLLKDYGIHPQTIEEQQGEEIPADLYALNESSRNHWLGVRRAAERKNNNTSWVGEFI